MRECTCTQPEPKVNRPSACVRCGYRLSPEWAVGDANVAEFYDRLQDACHDEEGELAPAFPYFRLYCEARERAGRSRFRLAYLNRDNITEAFEEASDGANYAMFEVFKNRRVGEDEQMDMALLAAYHFYRAFDALARMRKKEHGEP